jgi:hypothetical protein
MEWIAMFAASMGVVKVLKDQVTLSRCREIMTGKLTPWLMSYGKP